MARWVEPAGHLNGANLLFNLLLLEDRLRQDTFSACALDVSCPVSTPLDKSQSLTCQTLESYRKALALFPVQCFKDAKVKVRSA